MKGYNGIAVFDENGEKLLMCKRNKNPYKGLLNFVGGKIEEEEEGLEAAYRELEEETTICKDDIILTHLMDFTYYINDFYLEIYVGKLNKHIDVSGDENELYWLSLEKDFFDSAKYAGEGNIGHIMKNIDLAKEQLFK